MDLWNSLLPEAIEADSISRFKKILDRFMENSSTDNNYNEQSRICPLKSLNQWGLMPGRVWGGGEALGMDYTNIHCPYNASRNQWFTIGMPLDPFRGAVVLGCHCSSTQGRALAPCEQSNKPKAGRSTRSCCSPFWSTPYALHRNRSMLGRWNCPVHLCFQDMWGAGPERAAVRVGATACFRFTWLRTRHAGQFHLPIAAAAPQLRSTEVRW